MVAANISSMAVISTFRYGLIYFIFICILANRTNSHAYATMLCPSLCRHLWSVTLCIVAKQCVLEQKLLLTAYWQSYVRNQFNWYQNEWPWPLHRCHLRSCQPLCHIHPWISRKPVEMEAWFQRTTNREWRAGNQMFTWLMASRDPERSYSWPQYV